jgi:dGTPase
MSEETEKAMKELRAFMFEHVYNNKRAKSEEGKAENLVITLYQYYFEHFDLIPDELKVLVDRGDAKEQVVCDYISAMTDRFAIATYEEIYIPKCWHG